MWGVCCCRAVLTAVWVIGRLVKCDVFRSVYEGATRTTVLRVEKSKVKSLIPKSLLEEREPLNAMVMLSHDW